MESKNRTSIFSSQLGILGLLDTWIRPDEQTQIGSMNNSFLFVLSSQLAISKAEVMRVSDTLESAQAEWSRTTCCLESELSQATADKVR